MRKILVITDMDSNGSGYRNICTPLFSELAKMEYETKIVGLMSRGEEHNHPFAIIPAQNVEEAQAIGGNLVQLWNPDVVIVALDLPLQIRLHSHFSQFKKKYIAITPLENGPLCMSWAAPLFNMDAVFFISELGKQEALKVGVQAEHLQVGVDTVSWRPAFPEEKKQIRDGLGIPQDTFVVLTVADNQERKNLWAAMASISLLTHEGLTVQDILDGNVRKFPKTRNDVKYVLVTREQSPFGWKLRDLAVSMDINQEYTPYERGMSQETLWGLYAVADVYLQTSKAEGLGLPVLDAMACKVPVVATDTGALHELLDTGRGLLIDAEYEFCDVWGNSSRSMININLTMNNLYFIANSIGDDNQDDYHMLQEMTYLANEFVKQKTWDIPAKQLDEKIRELVNEPQTETPTK